MESRLRRAKTPSSVRQTIIAGIERAANEITIVAGVPEDRMAILTMREDWLGAFDPATAAESKALGKPLK